MKYVQINSFYNGSTGTLMRGLHNDLTEQGVDSYIFWGRRHETINDHEQCCASKLSVYHHGIMTRLFDRMGFYSKGDTKRLLEKIWGDEKQVQTNVVWMYISYLRKKLEALHANLQITEASHAEYILEVGG